MSVDLNPTRLFVSGPQKGYGRRRTPPSARKHGAQKYEAAAYLTLVEHGNWPPSTCRASPTYRRRRCTTRPIAGGSGVHRDDRRRAASREAARAGRDAGRTPVAGSLLTNAADELEDRWEQPDHDEHRVGVVKRPETVYERVRAQLNEAAVTAEFTMTLEQLELLLPELEAAAERGCSCGYTSTPSRISARKPRR